MKFVYFGDGVWGMKCLEKLIAEGHEPLAVVLRESESAEHSGDARVDGVAVEDLELLDKL